MPTYVYEILDKKGTPTGETFEVIQSMKEDALTKHPETGKPVRGPSSRRISRGTGRT